MTATTPTSFPPAHRPTWRAWLLFAPVLAWLLLFVVAPTAILFFYSFFRGGGGEVEAAFTLDNYARCFRSPYPKVFLQSLAYAGVTTALCALIGYPVAYYIGRCEPVRRNRLLILVMVPFWTSFLIRAYAWMTILSHDGLLNSLLTATRVIPVVFSDNLKLLYTPWAVLLALIYSYVPFMILPIYASVEKMDNSLIEAASDLGASPMRAFWRVTFPLTLPGLGAGTLMVFVPAIGMFAITTLMSGGTIVLIGDEIERSHEGGNLPFGSALGMILLFLFIVSFFLFARRGAASRTLSA